MIVYFSASPTYLFQTAFCLPFCNILIYFILRQPIK